MSGQGLQGAQRTTQGIMRNEKYEQEIKTLISRDRIKECGGYLIDMIIR